jgi:hypothetical protein
MLLTVFVLLAVPFNSFAQNTDSFEALKSELKACRATVLEPLSKESCQQLLLRVKVMEGYVATLAKESKSADESSFISGLQRDLELFRFQCALFDGHTTGVLGSFQSLLQSYMKYRDYRQANGR